MTNQGLFKEKVKISIHFKGTFSTYRHLARFVGFNIPSCLFLPAVSYIFIFLSWILSSSRVSRVQTPPGVITRLTSPTTSIARGFMQMRNARFLYEESDNKVRIIFHAKYTKELFIITQFFVTYFSFKLLYYIIIFCYNNFYYIIYY